MNTRDGPSRESETVGGASPGPRPARSRRRKCALAAVAVCLVTFGCVAIAEVGLRLHHGALFSFESLRRDRIDSADVDYDPHLGWVPSPGAFQRRELPEYVITPARLRSQPPIAATSASPIVTVGDSFTFGDEVADGETWPARLAEVLGRPVLNGGVSGYGLDQAALRAERLSSEHAPGIVVLAAIADDINRAEFDRYQAAKPYFVVEDGDLAPRSVPVPRGQPEGLRFGGLRSALSYSFVARAVLKRLTPVWWYFGAHHKVHDQGEEVAVRLLARLDAGARARDARFLFVALAASGRMRGDPARMTRVVEGARARGVTVLDLAAELDRRLADGDATHESVFMPGGHYTPDGNAWVAKRVAHALRSR